MNTETKFCICNNCNFTFAFDHTVKSTEVCGIFPPGNCYILESSVYDYCTPVCPECGKSQNAIIKERDPDKALPTVCRPPNKKEKKMAMIGRCQSCFHEFTFDPDLSSEEFLGIFYPGNYAKEIDDGVTYLVPACPECGCYQDTSGIRIPKKEKENKVMNNGNRYETVQTILQYAKTLDWDGELVNTLNEFLNESSNEDPTAEEPKEIKRKISFK